MHVGIDASNLRFGGGLTHLVQLLEAFRLGQGGCERVTVWAGARTAARLPALPSIRVATHPFLDRGLPFRAAWQKGWLDRAARGAGIDVLLVPGGSYAGSFRPFVTMCRNMVPFDDAASARYGVSTLRLKWALLRKVQSDTMRRADGVVFLSETARAAVLGRIGPIRGRQALIPHGIAPRFLRAPDRAQHAAPREGPFRWLYVSTVDGYKHHPEVVRAAAALAARGIALRLDLVGNAVAPWGERLSRAMAEADPGGTIVRYRGPIEFEELHRAYQEADGFVFASSCENLPNTLLEAMASALPIACSDRSVMPEVLGEGGIYLDPEDPVSIAAAMERLMGDPGLRARCAAEARRRVQGYSWPLCAERTFTFLAEIAGTSTPAGPLVGSPPSA